MENVNIFSTNISHSSQDVRYTKCILVDADDGIPWCSTKTDPNGQHIGGQGQWGHCPDSCPVAGRDQDKESSVILTSIHNKYTIYNIVFGIWDYGIWDYGIWDAGLQSAKP